MQRKSGFRNDIGRVHYINQLCQNYSLLLTLALLTQYNNHAKFFRFD